MTTAAGRCTAVAAAFELSCRRLDETSARVFRLLPVNRAGLTHADIGI